MARNDRLQVGDPVPQGVCLNVDGEPVALDTLWPEGPVFLTFLRHFG
jgi:hypothetical protein